MLAGLRVLRKVRVGLLLAARSVTLPAQTASRPTGTLRRSAPRPECRRRSITASSLPATVQVTLYRFKTSTWGL